MNRRYLQHFALFGKTGQYAILDAKVLVIGVGGLGCSVLYNLVGAGVGEIAIVDFDRISESNLNRQFLFDNASIHKLKVDAAQTRLKAFNPDCKIHRYPARIQDCSEIISEYEIIVDCSDNFETRFYLNRLCHLLKKPLISGAVIGYSGYVIVIKSFVSIEASCYQCFCYEKPKQAIDHSCEGGGVIGAAVNVIGSIQSMKVIQEILRLHPEDSGTFIFCDVLLNKFRRATILKDPSCNVCGSGQFSKT
ncbi:thiF family protein [Neorickettsia helminthoeca str. Oregon]|uniref:ThiF family protein n=1 Tax=Neorickettsia helminthoeca str. Oregon TaxID=1286528 RepID=X5GX87_9RICK|nr:HesA/MoeB/ThiF family protein [Neorickettsia helminthoeca]AHX11667.1 thiF family protein [Neorickettsia helminthoeca str. Oregon]